MATAANIKTLAMLEMLKLKEKTAKQAFVDPGLMASGGADPMAAGAPPEAAPAPPPGPDPMIAELSAKVDALASQFSAGGGAAAGAAGGKPLQPKVDVNATLMQILKIVAKIAEGAGIQIPPSDMVPTSQDLTQLASMSQSGNFSGLSQSGGGAIPPIEPMQGALPPTDGGEKAGSGNLSLRDRFLVTSELARMVSAEIGKSAN